MSEGEEGERARESGGEDQPTVPHPTQPQSTWQYAAQESGRSEQHGAEDGGDERSDGGDERSDGGDERSQGGEEGQQGESDSPSRVSVVDEEAPRPAPPPGADADDYKFHTYKVYPS